jgi:hypothetical protein
MKKLIFFVIFFTIIFIYPVTAGAQAHFFGLGVNLDFSIEEGREGVVLAGDIRYQFLFMPINKFSAIGLIPNISIGSKMTNNSEGFYIHGGIFINLFFPLVNINAGGQFYFVTINGNQSIGFKIPIELELFLLPFFEDMNSPLTYSVSISIRPDIPIIGEGLGLTIVLGYRVYILTFLT